MKFPRNAKVFRGELNAAPLVSVLFLLVLFVVLAGLVYTPGVPIRLDPIGSTNAASVVVSLSSTGSVRLADRTFGREELDAFRDELARLPLGSGVRIEAQPGAPKGFAEEVRAVVARAGQIEPPVAAGALGGTTNRTVAVAVNLAGQFFYRNRQVDDAQLRQFLSDAVGERVEPLTLVVLADRAVDHATLLRLNTLARDAGIREVLLAARPGPFENRPIR